MRPHPKSAVPTLLLKMAIESLSEPIATLLDSGHDPADHVWAYFDGRVRPGRAFAVMHLQKEGASLEQATRQIDGAIKTARARGSIFAFGVMTTKDGLVSLLRGLGGAAGLEGVASWVQEPIPADTVRLVIISGVTMQLQLVQIGAAPK